jgi:hypothetical protein
MNRQLTRSLTELRNIDAKVPPPQPSAHNQKRTQEFVQRELQLAESRRECEFLRKELVDLRSMSDRITGAPKLNLQYAHDSDSHAKAKAKKVAEKAVPRDRAVIDVSSTSDALRIIMFEIKRLQISLGNSQIELNEAQAQVSDKILAILYFA